MGESSIIQQRNITAEPQKNSKKLKYEQQRYNKKNFRKEIKEMDTLPSTNYHRGETPKLPSSSDGGSGGGRFFGSTNNQHCLSETDERILLDHSITIIDYLGSGHFGDVWKGRYSISGTIADQIDIFINTYKRTRIYNYN